MLRPIGLCAALVLATATPAHAAAQADLTVTAEVTPGVYVPDQEVPFKVTITNKGGADATGVKARASSISGSGIFVQSHDWGDLGEHGPGGTVKAGATRTFDLKGTFSYNQGDTRMRISLSYSGDANPADNETFADVDVIDPGVRGSISGYLFGDENKNGRRDMFEWPIEGAEVSTYFNGQTLRTTTDQNGRFTFADLEAREYQLYFDKMQGGWVTSVSGEIVRVDGGPQSTTVVADARRPLTDELAARIDLEQNSYATGAEARIKVTLTNKANWPLTGIRAACDRGGSSFHVEGTFDPARWGDLVYSGPGVTLQPFETKVFDVTGVVPAAAANSATAFVACDFGQDETWLHGHPYVVDAAKVPGAPNGPVRGQLYHDRDGDQIADADEFIAGVRTEIVDWTDDRVIASPVTDANGRITVENVPSGPYRFRITGPGWKFAHEGGSDLHLFGGCERCWPDWVLQVVPA